MARKVSLIVIWPSFENKMVVMSHVKWDYPIKKALYLPYHCYHSGSGRRFPLVPTHVFTSNCIEIVTD